MQKMFFLLSIFFSCHGFSQDSLSYKKTVDSVLISRSKTKAKKINVQSGSFRIRYFFEKSTKELTLIEVIESDNNQGVWIYNYQFIDGKLTMMNKYNDHGVGDKMRKIAFYYFKDNVVVCRVENETSIENIDAQMTRAEKLKSEAPKY